MPRETSEPQRGLRPDDATIESLFRLAEERRYEPGALVVQQGEPGDRLYLVLEGYADVVRRLPDGRSVVVARCGPGDHFGERALMPGRPGLRTADVVAHTALRAATVGREAFLAALERDHPLEQRLLEVMDAQLLADLAHESELVRSLRLGRGDLERERRLEAGEVLFEQGDPADALYLVLEGRIGVVVNGEARASLGVGECFGELGLVERAPRSATARALQPSRLLVVDGARFQALVQESAQARELFSTLQRVYRLPHRGVVTRHSGQLHGRPAVSHVFELPDGRAVVASRVLGEDIYQADQADSAPTRTLTWVEPERQLRRELRLDAEGHVVGLTAHGPWRGLAELQRRLLEGEALPPALLEGFEGSGELDFDADGGQDDALMCSCVPTRRADVNAALSEGHTTVEALRERLGCGSVCGACVPGLRHVLGNERWVPVRLERHQRVAEGARRLTLKPIGEAPWDFLPGQHVVVSGLVEGEWVQRAYTLTCPPRGAEAYEIVVKREPQGLFSRWLCDEASADHLLRVSPPRGDYFWQPVGRPAVCLVAGIGVTPALAMLCARAQGGWTEPLHVDLSVRDSAQLVGREAFEAGGEGVSFTWRATAEQGRLGQAEVETLRARFPDAEYFLCGPDGFMSEVKGLLKQAGVRGRDIYVESFAPAEAKAAPPKGQAVEAKGGGLMRWLRGLFGGGGVGP